MNYEELYRKLHSIYYAQILDFKGRPKIKQVDDSGFGDEIVLFLKHRKKETGKKEVVLVPIKLRCWEVNHRFSEFDTVESVVADLQNKIANFENRILIRNKLKPQDVVCEQMCDWMIIPERKDKNIIMRKHCYLVPTKLWKNCVK